MAIQKLTLEEIKQKTDADCQAELPDTDLKDTSILSIMSTMMAGVYSQTGMQIEQVQKNIFPTTATDGFLEEWASTVGISREAGTKAQGGIVVSADAAGLFIDTGEQLTASNGDVYIVQSTAETAVESIQVTLVLNGSTVTATAVAGTFKFALGQLINMLGADQPEYNGEKRITDATLTTFEFDITGSPDQPTGTPIMASDTMAQVFVESELAGVGKNLLSGSYVDFVTIASAISPIAIVGIDGIDGGSDVESDDSLRVRLLAKKAFNPPQFSPKDIENIAKQTKVITRVSVFRATLVAGQTTVYCAADNTASSIPSPAVLNTVKFDLVAKAPVYIADLDQSTPEAGDIIVKPVTTQIEDFSISELDLSTDSMKQAIKDNLKSFFTSGVKIGDDVKLDTILATIKNTVDPITGAVIKGFILLSPTTDLINTDGNIFKLGTVTFDN